MQLYQPISLRRVGAASAHWRQRNPRRGQSRCRAKPKADTPDPVDIHDTTLCTRRTVLHGSLAFTVSRWVAPVAAYARPPVVLYVGAAPTNLPVLETINDALKVADSVPPSQPVVICVASGVYNERLVLKRQEVTIQAWPLVSRVVHVLVVVARGRA
jgi:hypothetical protein